MKIPSKTQKSNNSWFRTTTLATVLGVIGLIMVMGAWFYLDLPPAPSTPMEISKINEKKLADLLPQFVPTQITLKDPHQAGLLLQK